MSKYKYQKEFMFSIRRQEEVELFLEDQENPLDLPIIRDNHRNTVIHHTSYHNQPKVLQTYLKYYRKNLESQGYSIAQIKLKTRHFLDEPNSQGYTAIHYAAYRGNISVLKLLQKYEAHLLLTNHVKMTVLHLAAQGDKPATFMHLHQKKLDLNQKDEKLSTPLHWASFTGSQKIVDYLLAQPGIEVNEQDSQGLTPLHLAATYGNSKIVKKLLLAGADRYIKNAKDQIPRAIAEQKQFDGIVRMLNDKYTLIDKIKIICNTKMKYEPKQKSDLYPIAFAIISVFYIVLPFGILQPSFLILLVAQALFIIITLLIFASLVLQNRKLPTHPSNYSQFSQTARLFHLCMVCVRQMIPRQHHCSICKICIKQYDHHCTWINNCVGKHNLLRFVLLLWMLEVVVIGEAYMAVETIIRLLGCEISSALFDLREWNNDVPVPAYIVSTIILLLTFFFAIPLLCLIFVQMKNLLLGKTTYQRFSKSNQSILTRQSSLLMNQYDSPPKPRLSNCLVMCCGESAHKLQVENASSTTTSFIRQQQHS